VGHGWRVHYEVALVAWMRKEKPTLEQVEAVVIWASRRRSLGPNVAEHISSPDPDRPEDFITTIRKARVDVLYLAFEGDDPVMLVRDFSGY
jgi:hypothetical protein